jgi:hypothetical protein
VKSADRQTDRISHGESVQFVFRIHENASLLSIGDYSNVIQLPERETDHVNPFSDEVKNEWRCFLTSPMRFHDVVLN